MPSAPPKSDTSALSQALRFGMAGQIEGPVLQGIERRLAMRARSFAIMPFRGNFLKGRPIRACEKRAQCVIQDPLVAVEEIGHFPPCRDLSGRSLDMAKIIDRPVGLCNKFFQEAGNLFGYCAETPELGGII
ncbi:MAG: hypothetical protein P3W94_011165 [Paracoccus sp. (in: a-proteobacteria)]|nr:hypothetical protein [Paracoccus sp. (in: a-proteobacteria)]